MENAWSRAKRALSQRLCVSLPRTRDDVAGTTSSYGEPSSDAGGLLSSSSTASACRSSKVMLDFSLFSSLYQYGIYIAKNRFRCYSGVIPDNALVA